MVAKNKTKLVFYFNWKKSGKVSFFKVKITKSQLNRIKLQKVDVCNPFSIQYLWQGLVHSEILIYT